MYYAVLPPLGMVRLCYTTFLCYVLSTKEDVYKRQGQGHEAGIATLPAYRRQGCALEALRSWTAAVLEQGIIPLYSTDLHLSLIHI